jgi:TetR/AcrR family tetracycline transcriptional repressor
VTGRCSGVKGRIGGHMADDTTSRTRPRGFLSRELIIKEALALLDEHGPGALSMRRLADRLGVAPTALYTHVRGKADLINGLIDQVYAGLTLKPDPDGDWTQQLTTLSQAIRAHLLAHPAVVPYALQQPGLGPHSLRLGEAIYNVLRPAGFSDQAVVGIVYALLTYILGFVALEVPRAGTDPQTSDEFVRRMWAFFAALPPGEFPHTVELAPLLARISTDNQFEFGIRTFLAGLQAQQPEREQTRP